MACEVLCPEWGTQVYCPIQVPDKGAVGGQVDDLGGLLAVACANAVNIEDSRGMLGFLNTLGGCARQLLFQY